MKENLKFWGTIAGVVLLVALCGVGIYGLKVAWSPVKGAGDTVVKNNSVNNRTQAQERFRKLYAAVETNAANILVAEEAAKAHPNDRILGTNLTGAVQMCITSVNDYNAEVGKVLSRDWLPADLPASIDPNTTCRRSQTR